MDVLEELRDAVKWTQSFGEEVANSVSHGVGLVGAAIGTPVLLLAAANRGSIHFTIGAAVFAATMLLLYFGSTVYHACPQTPLKRAFQVVDHSAIFLLIAGTYTPFALGPLRGPWGWSSLVIVWLLAIGGVILKIKKGVHHRPRLMLALYLAMGWLVLVVIRPLAQAVPPETIWWLGGGGLAYTAGIIFFVREHVRYNHFVWHVFVLAGTLCHYVAVLTYATATNA
ncbi:MAG: hemolysin III family protein [Chthoniobacterales bacterium]|nr:hemolysin III family protein [Chthoniobacterales bacterium]